MRALCVTCGMEEEPRIKPRLTTFRLELDKGAVCFILVCYNDSLSTQSSHIGGRDHIQAMSILIYPI